MEFNKLKNTYIIAEIGLNHNGDYNLAKRMIDVAFECGCNAVKLQKRHVDQMAISEVLNKPFTRFSGFGSTVREVRENMELNKEEYRLLRDYSRDKIDFIVTPFDIQSLNFLDDLDIDSYKIASHSNTDIPLLKETAKRNKPVIVSTGMCSEEEIKEITDIFKNCDLALLHCVSQYPCDNKSVNLKTIKWLERFGVTVGYSDHQDGISVSLAAVAQGAKIIEKHFTIDKNLIGFDHHMSITPPQLKELVKSIREIEDVLSGDGKKRILPNEMNMFNNRRKSVYAAREIKAGTFITEDMLTVKAPLKGLTPKFIPLIIGKKVIYDIQREQPITFGILEGL